MKTREGTPVKQKMPVVFLVTVNMLLLKVSLYIMNLILAGKRFQREKNLCISLVFRLIGTTIVYELMLK